MLTNIHIDGYRSLRNFQLSLNPGLNVFIGPNGSGKTNIFAFFEFVSNFVSYGIHRAIGYSGGANGTFCYEQMQGQKPEIVFSLFGTTRAPSADRATFYLRYKYSCRLIFDKELSEARLVEQRLSLKLLSRTPTVFAVQEPNRIKWDLEIGYSSDGEEFNAIQDFHVERPDLKKFLERFGRIRGFEEQCERAAQNSYFDQTCLIRALSFVMPAVRQIESDLEAGSPYNIDPVKAKKPDDIAVGFGLNSDGSGLAATLHAMKSAANKSRRLVRRIGARPRPIPRHAFKTISKYMRLINPSILKMDVKPDYFINNHIIQFHVDTGCGSIPLPISSMSDGTAKWLALVTAVYSESNIFSIEEPENFLHPKMQRELLDLVRYHGQDSRYKNITMISTHSTTLLDYCMPDEVLVVDFVDGSTIARRSQNGKKILEEIERTGFGLSYYALAGSLGY